MCFLAIKTVKRVIFIVIFAVLSLDLHLHGLRSAFAGTLQAHDLRGIVEPCLRRADRLFLLGCLGVVFEADYVGTWGGQFNENSRAFYSDVHFAMAMFVRVMLSVGAAHRGSHTHEQRDHP